MRLGLLLELLLRCCCALLRRGHTAAAPAIPSGRMACRHVATPLPSPALLSFPPRDLGLEPHFLEGSMVDSLLEFAVEVRNVSQFPAGTSGDAPQFACRA